MIDTHEIVCRILNRGGAEIHVLKAPGYALFTHGWLCTGCGEGTDPAGTVSALPDAKARRSAQQHADICRFLPA